MRPGPREPATEVSDLAYSSTQRLDIHAPGKPGPWPIVVILHGLGESRADWSPLAESIARQRAAVFNVGFRADEVG